MDKKRLTGTKDKPLRPCEGVRQWTTSKGWSVFEIHYTADPDKRSEEWKQSALDSMPDLQSYNREFEIDWTSTTGLAFYQAFYKKNIEEPGYYVRVQNVPAPPAVIYRGFDFGFRRPACVWAYQDRDGRLRVLREFSPQNMDVYEFRDTVRAISGEIGLDDKSLDNKPKAQETLNTLHPGVPWFSKDHQFVDFCGVEARKVNTLTGDHGEINDYEVMRSGGIDLHIVNQRVSAGTYIIRQLMKDYGGSPNLLIDPTCAVIIRGLAGGLTFGSGTKSTPLDDAIAPHPELSHLHDGLRYLVCGVFNVADMQKVINQGVARAQKRSVHPSKKEPPRYGPTDDLEDLPFWASLE